jgi:predicted N-acetyltransferase YhbS
VIEVRPCTAEDAAAVSALLSELEYEVSSEAAAERMGRLNETGSDPTFIAGEDGQPLGLIALHRCHMIQYRTPVVRITALVVHHRARRRGVELTSALNRSEAHAFYRELGFEPNSLRFRKSIGG